MSQPEIACPPWIADHALTISVIAEIHGCTSAVNVSGVRQRTFDGTSVKYSAGMIWSVSMFCNQKLFCSVAGGRDWLVNETNLGCVFQNATSLHHRPFVPCSCAEQCRESHEKKLTSLVTKHFPLTFLLRFSLPPAALTSTTCLLGFANLSERLCKTLVLLPCKVFPNMVS